MANFKTQLKIGQIAEEAIIEAFRNNGIELIDVREDSYYQKRDIDFIFADEDSDTTIEVKNDKRAFYTGNLFIELLTDEAKGYKGWIHYCKANILIEVVENKAYIFNFTKLREYIESKVRTNNCRIARCFDYGGRKVRVGAIIPIYELVKTLKPQIFEINLLEGGN